MENTENSFPFRLHTVINKLLMYFQSSFYCPMKLFKTVITLRLIDNFSVSTRTDNLPGVTRTDNFSVITKRE